MNVTVVLVSQAVLERAIAGLAQFHCSLSKNDPLEFVFMVILTNLKLFR